MCGHFSYSTFIHLFGSVSRNRLSYRLYHFYRSFTISNTNLPYPCASRALCNIGQKRIGQRRAHAIVFSTDWCTRKESPERIKRRHATSTLKRAVFCVLMEERSEFGIRWVDACRVRVPTVHSFFREENNA